MRMQNPSFGGSPIPARRYVARLALVLVAATAVVPVAASVASAEPGGGRTQQLPPQDQPLPSKQEDPGGRFNLPLYPPKPKPTVVVGPVQPGGGVHPVDPPVLVNPTDPGDPVDPADPADPAHPADPAGPAGPTDKAAPTTDPDDGGGSGGGDNGNGGGSDDGNGNSTDTGGSDDGSNGTGGSNGSGSGSGGGGSGSGGGSDSGSGDGAALPGTAVDPTVAPTGANPVGAGETADAYAEHGQSPVDPVKDAPPYALIAGLGLLGAGLVGLVALAVLHRPRAHSGS